jgi:hypothetical protein
MSRPINVAIAAVICLLMAASGHTYANTVSLHGEQDFPDGAFVASDSAWLTAQSNESLPTTALYGTPGFFTDFHSGLDPGFPAVLTLSLWNLDSSKTGNQVTDFWLDGIPQPISPFETGRPAKTVELFMLPVAASMLADGEVQIYVGLGPPSGNRVGLDFIRLELVPEPGSAFLLCGLAIGPVVLSRRRK